MHFDFEETKKRTTAEMTWRETATDKQGIHTQRDNKVAVSRLRPLTRWAARVRPHARFQIIVSLAYHLSANTALSIPQHA